MGLIAHCLLDMLIVFGFLTAICVIGGAALLAYAYGLRLFDDHASAQKVAAFTDRDRLEAAWELPCAPDPQRLA